MIYKINILEKKYASPPQVNQKWVYHGGLIAHIQVERNSKNDN
ncbi:hypothetical protein AQBE111736_09315 [Aquirufa beregesia]